MRLLRDTADTVTSAKGIHLRIQRFHPKADALYRIDMALIFVL